MALAFAFVALACASLRPQLAAARTIVPFVLVNDHVFVDVTLNGTGPYHFVLDSGSPFGLLDRAVARELALDVRARGTVGGVGDAVAPAGETSVRVLRVGDVAFARSRFVVTDLHTTIGEAEGRAIDGVLGRELFERFATTVDYARRTIVLGADVPALAHDGATLVPMQLENGIPQIACRIANVPAMCNVDTGSRLAITVPEPFAAAHPQIVPERRSAVGVDGYGLGGPAYGRIGRLATLAFGGALVTDTVCDFSTQRRGAFANPALGGNVGGGLLRRFTVTFDYAHRRIAFARNADFETPEPPDRSGLFLIARGDDVRVLDVRPATPSARAEIARDDRIVAIDDADVIASDLPAVRTRLAAESGSFVTVRIERDGIARDVVLRLDDYFAR